MKIDREHLHKIAHLARLEVADKDVQKLMDEMSAIVDWVEKLNEVDTTGVEPLTTMSHEINVMREDVVKETLPHDRALFNAPAKDQDYFRVPKVIE